MSIKIETSARRLWTHDALREACLHSRVYGRICAYGCSLNTRTLFEGELFIALSGAHSYIYDAWRKKAAGVMIPHTLWDDCMKRSSVISVPSTEEALRSMALYVRSRMHKVVGITGSVGKTTTRHILHTLYEHQRIHHGFKYPICSTHGNENNELGVPLTLVRSLDNALCFVEMGIGQAGQMDEIASLAQPDISVITALGDAHSARFSSTQEMVCEKLRLVAYTHHTVILPSGTKWHNLLQSAAAEYGIRVLWYGCRREDDVCLLNNSHTSYMVRLKDENKTYDYSIPKERTDNLLPQTLLAVCGVLLAQQHGYFLEDIPYLHRPAGRGRSEKVVYDGGEYILYDDTYNASTQSVHAGLMMLSDPQKTLVIMGDMAEIKDPISAHKALADICLKARVGYVVCCGSLMRYTYNALQRLGIPSVHCDNTHDVCAWIRSASGKKILNAMKALWVKGSRSMRMERIIDFLRL